jgi:hypothetical protein
MTCRLRSRAPHSDGPEEKSWAIVIDHQAKCGRLFSLCGILEVRSVVPGLAKRERDEERTPCRNKGPSIGGGAYRR